MLNSCTRTLIRAFYQCMPECCIPASHLHSLGTLVLHLMAAGCRRVSSFSGFHLHNSLNRLPRNPSFPSCHLPVLYWDKVTIFKLCSRHAKISLGTFRNCAHLRGFLHRFSSVSQNEWESLNEYYHQNCFIGHEQIVHIPGIGYLPSIRRNRGHSQKSRLVPQDRCSDRQTEMLSMSGENCTTYLVKRRPIFC